MTAAALALTAAVLMHVAWNLLARAGHPDTRFLWWALVGYLIILGPWSLYALVIDAQWSWSLAMLLVISALANAVYFLVLGAAYRHAPVALVYPIARSSPLLIALWSSLLFSEMIAASGWLGILITVAGLLLLAISARHGDTRRAVLWAVIAAFATSVYSLSNKFAVASLPTYGSQLGLVSVDLTISFIALSLEQRVRLAASASSQLLKPETMVTMDSKDGFHIDNFEGLARHQGKRFFIVSDNNDLFLQRTLLMYFELLDE